MTKTAIGTPDEPEQGKAEPMMGTAGLGVQYSGAMSPQAPYYIANFPPAPQAPPAGPPSVYTVRALALSEALRHVAGYVDEETAVQAAIVFEHYLRTGKLLEKNHPSS